MTTTTCRNPSCFLPAALDIGYCSEVCVVRHREALTTAITALRAELNTIPRPYRNVREENPKFAEANRFADFQRLSEPPPEFRSADGRWHTEGAPVLWLPFSAYELANVAAMFKAITPERYRASNGTIRSEPHPFNVFNSGDWTGVVGDRFVFATKHRCPEQGSNRSPEDYRTDALKPWYRPEE